MLGPAKPGHSRIEAALGGKWKNRSGPQPLFVARARPCSARAIDAGAVSTASTGATSMTELVTGALSGGVATITLNRPEAHNAMSWGLIDAFGTVAERLAGDPGTRAFLLRGEGKNFCVGGDIRAFAEEADAAEFIKRLAGRLHEGLKALFDHPAPVVVAAQGAA